MQKAIATAPSILTEMQRMKAPTVTMGRTSSAMNGLARTTLQQELVKGAKGAQVREGQSQT